MENWANLNQNTIHAYFVKKYALEKVEDVQGWEFYQISIWYFICNQDMWPITIHTMIVVTKFKPYSLSDFVHIFKERKMYSTSKIMNILFDLLVAYLSFCGFFSINLKYNDEIGKLWKVVETQRWWHLGIFGLQHSM
jgi:hypothetical protein